MSPQSKVDAATKALGRIKKRNASLANKIVSDWAAAGFAYTPTVAADLRLAEAFGRGDAGTVRTMMHDPDAVALVIRQGFGDTFRGIGAGAGAVARAPGQLLGPIAQGLHNAVPVPSFLAALSSRNTWLRVAEVVLGGALLLVALGKITGIDYGKVAGLVASRGASAATSLKSSRGAS